MQKTAAQGKSNPTASETEEALKTASCDELLMNLIIQSVNNIWNDYDTSKDGYLTLEESRVFLRESFGNTQ